MIENGRSDANKMVQKHHKQSGTNHSSLLGDKLSLLGGIDCVVSRNRVGKKTGDCNMPGHWYIHPCSVVSCNCLAALKYKGKRKPFCSLHVHPSSVQSFSPSPFSRSLPFFPFPRPPSLLKAIRKRLGKHSDMFIDSNRASIDSN